MKFLAEIIEIKQKKTASLDKEYSLRLVTDDIMLMQLSEIPADSLVVVEIKTEQESKGSTGSL